MIIKEEMTRLIFQIQIFYTFCFEKFNYRSGYNLFFFFKYLNVNSSYKWYTEVSIIVPIAAGTCCFITFVSICISIRLRLCCFANCRRRPTQ